MADRGDTLVRLSLQLWESFQSLRIVPIRGLFQRLARRGARGGAGRGAAGRGRHARRGDGRGPGGPGQGVRAAPARGAQRRRPRHRIPRRPSPAGKPAAGRVTLEARREGNTLVISVQDDGKGLDYDGDRREGPAAGLARPGRDARPRATPGLDLPARGSRRGRRPTRSPGEGWGWTWSRRRSAAPRHHRPDVAAGRGTRLTAPPPGPAGPGAGHDRPGRRPGLRHPGVPGRAGPAVRASAVRVGHGALSHGCPRARVDLPRSASRWSSPARCWESAGARAGFVA